MQNLPPDTSKLLGQDICQCVERSRADEDEFDAAEEEAIYWLIHDRVEHLDLLDHKMIDHIMLCLMPIAAATNDLDDLDSLIADVADWLNRFKSLSVMAKMAKINAEFFARLEGDDQLGITSDELKFYSAVRDQSTLHSVIQGYPLIFCPEGDAVCIHVPWHDDRICTLQHSIFLERNDGDDDDDGDNPLPDNPMPQDPRNLICV